jgi:hypothetical protein
LPQGGRTMRAQLKRIIWVHVQQTLNTPSGTARDL